MPWPPVWLISSPSMPTSRSRPAARLLSPPGSGQRRIWFDPPSVEPRIDTLQLRGSRFPRYTGKGCAPGGEPIFYYPLEPEGQRDACFVAVGTAEFAVAAEPLRLTAVKGFEYRLIGETVNAPRLDFFAVS